MSAVHSDHVEENMVYSADLKNKIPYCFIMHHLSYNVKILSSYLKGFADSKHPLFIKILDSVRGSPASNVPVKLYKEAADGSWELLNSK